MAHQDDFSLSYLKQDIRSYSLKALRNDLVAGLEVAFLTFPQAMAYALVAGLPISCGLFAAIFSAIAAAIMGSSKYLIVGPINAVAILVQAGTADILYSYYRDVPPFEKEVLALQIMTQIALLAGFFQVIVAVFKLGRMTQFVSHSVIVGYIAGGAMVIIINQIFYLTGISSLVAGVHSMYEKIVHLSTHLREVDPPTLVVSTASLALLLLLKKLSKRIPSAALMLIGVALFCYLISLSSNASFSHHVALIGTSTDLFEFFPLFSWPSFNWGIMNHMLSFAFAVTLLSIIETTCSAKSIAATSGQGVSINQEILAVGFANLVSSCTISMPVSVSNSRSQANLKSGAETRFAAIFSALIVASIVGYFGYFVNFIPLPALSALLLVTAFGLVNAKQLLLCIKSTRSDSFVLITTFISCIFLNLDTAFYIGVVLSICLYLKKAALPQLVEYAVEDTGELRSLDLPQAYMQKKIRVIKVEGELFFGSADIFYSTLKSLAEDDEMTKVILLQLKNARDIDATSCLALLQLHEYLERAGKHLILCGMTQEIWDVMSNSGLIKTIGKENLFVFDEKHPQVYLQKAIARAKHFVLKPEQGKVVESEEALQLSMS